MKLNTINLSSGRRPSRKARVRAVVSVLVWVKPLVVVTKVKTSRKGGGTIAPGFEGGQKPMHRRLPKFGFVFTHWSWIALKFV